MGQSKSKKSPKSYDVAPIDSDKKSSKKTTPKPTPKVELPVAKATSNGNAEQTKDITKPGTSKPEERQTPTTAAVVQTSENNDSKPKVVEDTKVQTKTVVQETAKNNNEKTQAPEVKPTQTLEVVAKSTNNDQIKTKEVEAQKPQTTGLAVESSKTTEIKPENVVVKQVETNVTAVESLKTNVSKTPEVVVDQKIQTNGLAVDSSKTTENKPQVVEVQKIQTTAVVMKSSEKFDSITEEVEIEKIQTTGLTVESKTNIESKTQAAEKLQTTAVVVKSSEKLNNITKEIQIEKNQTTGLVVETSKTAESKTKEVEKLQTTAVVVKSSEQRESMTKEVEVKNIQTTGIQVESIKTDPNKPQESEVQKALIVELSEKIGTNTPTTEIQQKSTTAQVGNVSVIKPQEVPVEKSSVVVPPPQSEKISQEVDVHKLVETYEMIDSKPQEVGVTKIQTTAVVMKSTENLNKITTQENPQIPSWVNETNFKNLLTLSNPDIKEIITFKVNPAMPAGENYATLILRVQITAMLQNGSTTDYSFMLKVPHENEQMKEMLKTNNFFLLENSVYSEIIPILENMYRQTGLDVKFGAKSYILPTDERDINYVLLDDLSLSGFKNANRLEGLNMEHSLLVLDKLAQFHAASACYGAKGVYSDIFLRNMDNDATRKLMNQTFSAFKKPFMDNLKTYDDGEKYYNDMDKFFDNATEEFIDCRKPRPGVFKVINHGDFWSNNILFKYTADGKLEETLFVDFQNCNWGSPAQDLFNFIISSIHIDIKLKQFDYFISYYYENLSKYLKLLKYPLQVPSLRELNMQLIDFGSWATIMSILALSEVLLDSTDNAKFEHFKGESKEGVDFKNAMFSNERYRKNMKEILPWLHKRGFMEVQTK